MNKDFGNAILISLIYNYKCLYFYYLYLDYIDCIVIHLDNCLEQLSFRSCCSTIEPFLYANHVLKKSIIFLLTCYPFHHQISLFVINQSFNQKNKMLMLKLSKEERDMSRVYTTHSESIIDAMCLV